LALRLLVCGLLALAAAACAQLPGAGPSSGRIVESAVDRSRMSYALVPVDEAVLDVLDLRRRASFAGTFGGSRGGTSETIGVGDIVVVTIWEAAHGGLFSTSSGTVGGGSKSTTIPDQQVSSSGTIDVPYAGAIRASGRTPEQVKASIEAALEGKAIEPQALVVVRRSMTNTVTVTGDVVSGQIVNLSPRGTRVLDAIASAGGIGSPTEEVMVELVRGRSTQRVPLTRVISNPAENVYLRPDDTLALLRKPLVFNALGATGANTDVRFPVTGITLDEAIARVGGLLDLRADPAGVFVFRYEQPDIAAHFQAAAGIPASAAGVPVVYRLDLRDPKGLFLAKRFEVADGDLVYVANANLNELQKFVALIGTVTQPTNQVRRTVEGF
jgi:polysaccharide biosynthesis/export protein